MKKWAIPSLVPFWYHLVPHHQTLPNLVYKLFKPFWTTISNCIFCLNEHRKTFISKGVDFRVFNDNATKWRTHLTYFIITALGTDMKLTNSQLIHDLEFVAYGGPTYDDLPAFQWSQQDFEKDTPHYGHPDLWKFEPVTHYWRF